MATQRQIQANRLNARNSTGPRTPAGKSRTSMNALRSGLYARTNVIRGEFPAQFEELCDEYANRFHPTTPEQRALVDILIDCEWLLRRFRMVEFQMWEQYAAESPATRHGTILAQSLEMNSAHLARLQRRVDSVQRNYRNALHELQRLQSEEAATLEEQSENPEIGSVPSNRPEAAFPAAPAASAGPRDPASSRRSGQLPGAA